MEQNFGSNFGEIGMQTGGGNPPSEAVPPIVPSTSQIQPVHSPLYTDMPVPGTLVAIPPIEVMPIAQPFQTVSSLLASTPVKPKKHHTGLILLFLFILLGGGGIAYGYYSGIIPNLFSKPPYDQSQFLTEIAGGAAKIETSSYLLSLNVHVENREGDAAPFVANSSPSISSSSVLTFLSLQSQLSQIPPNFVFDLSLGGSSQKTSAGINGKVVIDSSASLGDLSVAAGAEMRKIGDKFYVMVNKFPGLFGDISAIKQKWIKITPADVSQYGSAAAIFFNQTSHLQTELNDQNIQLASRFKLFLKIADQDHALQIIGSPVKEKIGNDVAYRYSLQFNRGALVQLYKDFMAASRQQFGDQPNDALDQENIAMLQDSGFNSEADYLSKNVTMDLWATTAGIPEKFSYTLRLVPDATSGVMQNKQVKFTTTLALSDINVPVVIEEPQQALSVEDAFMAVSGMSKEEYLYTQQLTDVGLTRAMLDRENYTSTDGKKYPAVLDSNVPLDVYTQKPFVYTVSPDGKDYTLMYTLVLPAYKKGLVEKAPYYSKVGKRYILNVVNGINTADSAVPSREAVVQSKIDSDGDGIPDALEVIVGTDKNKKDLSF